VSDARNDQEAALGAPLMPPCFGPEHRQVAAEAWSIVSFSGGGGAAVIDPFFNSFLSNRICGRAKKRRKRRKMKINGNENENGEQ